MTRSQMIETVARKTGYPESQVETTMDAMFDQIAGLHQPQDQGVQPAGVHLDPRLQGQRPLQAEAGGCPRSRRGRQGNGRDGLISQPHKTGRSGVRPFCFYGLTFARSYAILLLKWKRRAQSR